MFPYCLTLIQSDETLMRPNLDKQSTREGLGGIRTQELLPCSSIFNAVLTRTTIFVLISISVEIVIFMLTYGLGVGTIPWLLVGELCPIEV